MVKWKISKKENDNLIRLQNMTDILICKEYILKEFKEDAKKHLDEWFEKCESEKIFNSTGWISWLSGFALPLVRQTFPSLFANKIVGVQPMPAPVGLAYAMRVMYNTDEEGLSAKNNV